VLLGKEYVHAMTKEGAKANKYELAQCYIHKEQDEQGREWSI